MLSDMIRWDAKKDLWLQEHRDVSFQDIASCIISDNLVDMIKNPSRGGQEAFLFALEVISGLFPL